MADDVKVTFSADIGDLQRGLAEAVAGIAETQRLLKTGADQVGQSFASLDKAYAAGVARRVDLVKAGNDDELAVARSGERAQTEVDLDAVKSKQSSVREAAQLSQISRDDERAALLALESEREDIERRHLTFLKATYADDAAAYANVQRQIDTLAAQSALKRQEIERNYLNQVDAGYRRSFEQVGSSVATQIGQMIKGHESLRQAVGSVLQSILQDFIQARIRAVADWAAGVAAESTATTAGEAAKTGAVLAGTAARTGAQQTAAAAGAASTAATIVRSIIGSAAETFAGIFGFLAPVMGPAAVGPAAAGQAAVAAAASAVPSFASGAWSLPADMVANVHAGEMIVPAGPAALMRAAAGQGGAAAGKAGGGDTHHHTHFNVTAIDSRDVRRFFSDNAKHIIGAINDGVRTGSHLGMSKLGRS